jgi:quercetin dioxygenase-like cupin family protein
MQRIIEECENVERCSSPAARFGCGSVAVLKAIMNTFASLAELGPLAIWPGVLARVVQGAHITMAIVELSPNGVVSEHSHTNEQLGMVVRGSMTFRIGSERRELGVGDTYIIPSNVPHDVVAGPEGAVAIDVFSPVRADWARHATVSAQTPLWP